MIGLFLTIQLKTCVNGILYIPLDLFHPVQLLAYLGTRYEIIAKLIWVLGRAQVEQIVLRL
jgi:hypothetical protein